MRKALILACIALLLTQFSLSAQYSPVNSPQLHFQSYGNASAACPYLFIGAYRMQTPFYLKATAMLLDGSGDLLWYYQSPTHALDFKLHPDGRMAFNDNHHWHILDSTFTEVDAVACVGYGNDIHDMTMTADGHYFLICIEDTVMDLSALLTASGSPGSTQARVDGVVIQELDAGKNVVKEWHGLDHYALQDADSTYFTNPSVYEAHHTNSIDWPGNGKMLLSHRALNEICQVDWATGNVDWHLGGKRNEFDMQGSLGTIGQHDARYMPDGRISVFDNGNRQRPARAVVYQIDTLQMNVLTASSYGYIATTSDAMGSFRVLPDRSAIIGFGRVFPSQQPVASLVDSSGIPIFELRFLDSSSTYRALCADLPFALHRPQLVCQQQGAQAILSVQGQHGSFEWTTGEHSASIVVSSPGSYQVFVPQGIGMISSSAIHITDPANACVLLPREEAQIVVPKRKSIGKFDLLGRPLFFPASGQIYLERYSDGSSQKRVWMQ